MKNYVNDAILVQNVTEDWLNENILLPAIQRSAGAWVEKLAEDSLVSSVANGFHIGNLIFCVDPIGNTFLADGLQRVSNLTDFIKNNYRLHKDTPNSVVSYRKKTKDENGKLVRDENNNQVWEVVTFDIANHTFEEFPKELQSKILKYQIPVVRYDDCTMFDVNEITRLTNIHTAMNNNQKAYTYLIDSDAKSINAIEASGFFKEDWIDTKRQIKGEKRKIIMDILMLIFHSENWKKTPIAEAKYINSKVTKEEFAYVEEISERIGELMDGDIEFAFTPKNTLLWFGLFAEFDKMNLDNDELFKDFIVEFGNELLHKEVDGTAFSDIDNSYSKDKQIDENKKKAGNKDRGILFKKYEILKSLMREYFSYEDETEEVKPAEIIEETGYYETQPVEEDNTYNGFFPGYYYEEIIKADVCKDLANEEIVNIGNKAMALLKDCNVSDFEEDEMVFTKNDYDDVVENLNTFDRWACNVDPESSFFNDNTIAAMIAIAAYSFEKDIKEDTVEEWFEKYVDSYNNELSNKTYHNTFDVLKDNLNKFLSFHNTEVA